MKRENEIGAILGLVFGCFSFISLFLRAPEGEDDLLEFFLFISTVIFYATLFGRRAGKKIKNRRPILVGFAFVLLTYISVFSTIGIVVAFIEQDPNVLLMFFYSLLFCLTIGAIPILITALLFGYILRFLINPK